MTSTRRFLRRGHPRTWLLLSLAWVLWPAPALAQQGPGPGPERYEAQLGNIDTALTYLERAYGRPDASLQTISIQRRLVDARVFYELGQYENTAMLLLDLVDRPDFHSSLDYDSTVLLLGESLFRLGNMNAARTTFQKAARGRDAEVVDEARLYLLEIALASGQDEAIAQAIAETPRAARTDRMKYGLGKASFQLGRLDDASRYLGSISAGSPWHERARYYLGATFVASRQYDAALDVYRTLTKIEPDDALRSTIRDEAWLAVGRLLVERQNYALALTSYQNIGRNSPHYESALYEMAWAYINQELYEKAIQTVDVLLLNVSDPDMDVSANVLRGQLHVALKDYDEAIGSYEAIIERFAPIRNELARFVDNPEDVQRYFEWLTRRNRRTAALQSPLTPRTIAWLETSGDVARAAEVFDGLATQREAIESATQIGTELVQILGERGRVEVFPELKEGWARLQVAENQLVRLLVSQLDAQRAELRQRLPPSEQATYDAIHQRRARLAEQAARLPVSVEAFNQRQEYAIGKFRDLARRHFLLQRSLDELQRQLLALEKHLNDRQFADGGPRLGPGQEGSLRADIQREKDALQGVYDELLSVSRAIDLETRKLGAGDDATRGEQSLKAQLFRVIEEEGRFFDQVAGQFGADVDTRYRGIADSRQRARGLLVRIASLVSVLDAEVRRKTGELLRTVQLELGLLGGYGGEVTELTADGDDIARRYGLAFFEAALERMAQVVLDADVGLLDVVWARKDEKTETLKRLNEERGQRLQNLQRSLESIKTGAGDESFGRAAAGGTP